jgi:hypothetical protein
MARKKRDQTEVENHLTPKGTWGTYDVSLRRYASQMRDIGNHLKGAIPSSIKAQHFIEYEDKLTQVYNALDVIKVDDNLLGELNEIISFFAVPSWKAQNTTFEMDREIAKEIKPIGQRLIQLANLIETEA